MGISTKHMIVGALAGILGGVALSWGYYLFAAINAGLSWFNCYRALKLAKL